MAHHPIDPAQLHGVEPVIALPVRHIASRHDLVIVGAHGGSGETRLASLRDSWVAADHQWLAHPDGQPTVVCARTHAAGLDALGLALRQWASGQLDGVNLVGVVVLADQPGRLPRVLADRCKVLEGACPASWRVGFIDGWRFGDYEGVLPRSLRQFMNDMSQPLVSSGKENP